MSWGEVKFGTRFEPTSRKVVPRERQIQRHKHRHFPQNGTCMHTESTPQFYKIYPVKSTCRHQGQGIGLVKKKKKNLRNLWAFNP